MDPTDVQKIVDSVKTLNLNVNDVTTQKLADALIPVVKLYLLRDYVRMGLNFLGVVVVVVAIVYLVLKRDEERSKGWKRN